MNLTNYVLVLIFLIIFIATSLQQNGNPDMYFHLASGNVIAHQGIIHHDVLSQAGSNRQWIPAEWLFQLVFYWFITLFGFASYGIFIGIFSTIQIAALYIFLRRILRVNVVFSLGLSLLYVLFVYDFLVARPQIIATTFLIVEIYILLHYILKNKNYLYLLLPLTYIWANLHSSVIFSPFFCFAYFVFCLFNAYLNKKEETIWLKKAKALSLLVIGVGIATILPPQGFMQYQNIFLFIFKYGSFNSVYLYEWHPLYRLASEFISYTCLVGITLISLFFVIKKKKSFAKFAWTFPLLIFIPYGYTAFRNIYYSYFTVIVLLGWLLSQLNFRHISKSLKILFCITVIAVFGFEIWRNWQFLQTAPIYPSNAADFIQKQNLQGNMFNQYDYGGYFEYRLYPTHKVFLDGREDVFLCCEIPDLWSLAVTLVSNATLPDTEYNTVNNKLVNSFFEKYHISYVVFRMYDGDPLAKKISEILVNDPKWRLVFGMTLAKYWLKTTGKIQIFSPNLGRTLLTRLGICRSKKA